LNAVPNSSLLESLRTGNGIIEAIAILYKEYFPFLAMYVMHNHGSRQDAEDVFQETIVRFLDLVKNNRFRGESGIRTILYSINRNTWLNELKRRGKSMLRENIYAKQYYSPEPGIAKKVEKKDSEYRLSQVFDLLGKTCREILTRHYLEELSFKELLPYFHEENEKSLRKKKCKCEEQLKRIVRKNREMNYEL
jgi:RNA polymerase sigma factor (sigma-70 family)